MALPTEPWQSRYPILVHVYAPKLLRQSRNYGPNFHSLWFYLFCILASRHNDPATLWTIVSFSESACFRSCVDGFKNSVLSDRPRSFETLRWETTTLRLRIETLISHNMRPILQDLTRFTCSYVHQRLTYTTLDSALTRWASIPFKTQLCQSSSTTTTAILQQSKLFSVMLPVIPSILTILHYRSGRPHSAHISEFDIFRRRPLSFCFLRT